MSGRNGRQESREGLSEKITRQQGTEKTSRQKSAEHKFREESSRQRSSKCKGPEVGVCPWEGKAGVAEAVCA